MQTRRVALRMLASVPIAGMPATAQADPDARLLALIADHGRAHAAREAAWFVEDELAHLCHAQEPPRPSALAWRLYDDFDIDVLTEETVSGGRRRFYSTKGVLQLAEQAEPSREEWTGTREQWVEGDWSAYRKVPDPERIARRAEILAAGHAWEAECKVLADGSGLTAAIERSNAAHAALDTIATTIVATKAVTRAGIAAKARWTLAIGDEEATRAFLSELRAANVEDHA